MTSDQAARSGTAGTDDTATPDGTVNPDSTTTSDGAPPLVIAANRLPVMQTDDGWSPSPGGLVRALWPMLKETGGTWVGWTGTSEAADPFRVDGVDLHPIDISAEEIELYYEGFSNDGLWPL